MGGAQPATPRNRPVFPSRPTFTTPTKKGSRARRATAHTDSRATRLRPPAQLSGPPGRPRHKPASRASPASRAARVGPAHKPRQPSRRLNSPAQPRSTHQPSRPSQPASRASPALPRAGRRFSAPSQPHQPARPRAPPRQPGHASPATPAPPRQPGHASPAHVPLAAPLTAARQPRRHSALPISPTSAPRPWAVRRGGFQGVVMWPFPRSACPAGLSCPVRPVPGHTTFRGPVGLEKGHLGHEKPSRGACPA